MLKVYLEKLHFQIGKLYMTNLHLSMIISKRDIINIILLIIEQKEPNIPESMETIHLKNFSYMINLKFIAPIIKLALELLNQQLPLFLVMVVLSQRIDSNIIWII